MNRWIFHLLSSLPIYICKLISHQSVALHIPTSHYRIHICPTRPYVRSFVPFPQLYTFLPLASWPLHFAVLFAWNELTLHLDITGLGSFIFPWVYSLIHSPKDRSSWMSPSWALQHLFLPTSEHTSHCLATGSLSSLHIPKQLEDRDLVLVIFYNSI